MAIGILSQMDESRKRKEKLLKNKELTTPVLTIGGMALLVGILLLAFTGLLIAGQGESSSTATSDSGGNIICTSVACLIGALGFVMLLFGIVRASKSHRELQAEEGEYQKLRSQVISSMEDSGIR